MKKQTEKLNRLNNELEVQLSKENDEVFTNMICYLRVADLSEYDQELVRHDLLEMILSAQKRGETIHDIIGQDYKGFCEDIIASLPSQSEKNKSMRTLSIIFLCVAILIVIRVVISQKFFLLVRNIFTGETLNFQVAVSLGDLITSTVIIIASFATAHFIGKTSFQSIKPWKIFVWGAGLMAVLLCCHWIGREILFTVNVFVAVFLVVVFYFGYKVFSLLY